MSIEKKKEDSTLTVFLEGKLTNSNVSDIDASIQESMEGIDTLILDFEKLVYISSAGLRLVLTYYQLLNPNQGKLIIKNACENVRDIFYMTGLDHFLLFE